MIAAEKKRLTDYTVRVGAKSYLFPNVEITANAAGKMVLSYAVTRPMVVAVARSILAEEGSSSKPKT